MSKHSKPHYFEELLERNMEGQHQEIEQFDSFNSYLSSKCASFSDNFTKVVSTTFAYVYVKREVEPYMKNTF